MRVAPRVKFLAAIYVFLSDIDPAGKPDRVVDHHGFAVVAEIHPDTTKRTMWAGNTTYLNTFVLKLAHIAKAQKQGPEHVKEHGPLRRGVRPGSGDPAS